MTGVSHASPFSNRTSISGALLDILPLIFYHAVPSYDSLSNIPLPSPYHSPLNVTHVCHLWRRIALATPCLWSAIRFEVNVDDTISDWDGVGDLGEFLSADRWGWELSASRRVTCQQEYYERRYKRKRRVLERKLEWICAWLSRSGTSDEVPMDLCVDIPEFQDKERLVLDAEYEEISRQVKIVVSDFIKQRTRWRNVKMDVHFSMLPLSTRDLRRLEDLTYDQFNTAENTVIVGTAAKLTLDKLISARSLSVRFYAVNPHRDAQLPIGVFLDVSHSSRLRELDIRGPWPQLQLNSKPETAIAGTEVRFVQGTHIPGLKRVELKCGYQFTFDSLVAFLSAISQSIEEFVGVMPVGGSRGALPSSREDNDKITMPNLHVLVVKPTSASQSPDVRTQCELLRILDAPKIETLQVRSPRVQVDAESVGRSVVEFVSRSQSQTGLAGLSRRLFSGEGGEIRGLMHLKLAGTLHGDWLVTALPKLSNLRSIELHVSCESKEVVHEVLLTLSGLNTPSLPCPLLEKASIGGVAMCEDTIAAFLSSRTQPSPSAQRGALRCIAFRNSRFVHSDSLSAGSGLGRRGDGLEMLLGRKEVKEALRRGLKVVFA